MKIKCIASLIALCSAICWVPFTFAETAIAKPAVSLSHGTYVGGQIGYDYAPIYNNFLFQYTTSHGPSTLGGYSHSAASGVVGGGSIGYGRMFKNYLYLGAELFANISTASTNNQAIYDHFHETGRYDGDGYHNTISVKNNTGISLLPGIQVNQNVLFYGRLGFSKSHIGGNERVIFYSEPLGVPTSTTPHSISFSPNGFNYGLGFETALVKHISVRGEFIRTEYQSFTSQLNNKISVSTNQAMIGLLYHFA